MLDIHTHILPNMDDGSSSIEESLQMLEELEKQGVDTVCLTPHFYADREDISDFLKRREVSYKELTRNYKGPLKLLLGAEVAYYKGIANSDLECLCIEGTNILMVELSYFHKCDLNELVVLNSKLQVLLAHIERFGQYYKKRDFLDLSNRGIYLQVNAESFRKEEFKHVKDYFEESCIDFIGSDCHNMTNRKPNMEDARIFISEKYSKEVCDDFISHGRDLLKGDSNA